MFASHPLPCLTVKKLRTAEDLVVDDLMGTALFLLNVC